MASTHFPTSNLGIAPYRFTIVIDEVAENEISPVYPNWERFFYSKGELKFVPQPSK